MSLAKVKPFYLRPVDLRYEFEDEFTHAAWGPDLGLAEASTAASPVYTLFDHKTVQGKGDTWSWEYRGRYQDRAKSQWLTEDEVKGRSTPLQLDVFHVMWETYQTIDSRLRPDGVPSKGERDASSREEALKLHPVGTQVRREFADGMGQAKAFTGVIYYFNEPYWRVRYPDGDWEELNGQQVKKGRQHLADASSRSSH